VPLHAGSYSGEPPTRLRDPRLITGRSSAGRNAHVAKPGTVSRSCPTATGKASAGRLLRAPSMSYRASRGDTRPAGIRRIP